MPQRVIAPALPPKPAGTSAIQKLAAFFGVMLLIVAAGGVLFFYLASRESAADEPANKPKPTLPEKR